MHGGPKDLCASFENNKDNFGNLKEGILVGGNGDDKDVMRDLFTKYEFKIDDCNWKGMGVPFEPLCTNDICTSWRDIGFTGSE